MVHGHGAEMMPVFGVCFILFIALAFSILKLLVFCKIYSKAGYPWAMGFLMLIPVVDVIYDARPGLQRMADSKTVKTASAAIRLAVRPA